MSLIPDTPELIIFLEAYISKYDEILLQYDAGDGLDLPRCTQPSEDIEEYYFNDEIKAWIDENMSGPVSHPTWYFDCGYKQKFRVKFECLEDKLLFEMKWLYD